METIDDSHGRYGADEILRLQQQGATVEHPTDSIPVEAIQQSTRSSQPVEIFIETEESSGRFYNLPHTD